MGSWISTSTWKVHPLSKFLLCIFIFILMSLSKYLYSYQNELNKYLLRENTWCLGPSPMDLRKKKTILLLQHHFHVVLKLFIVERVCEHETLSIECPEGHRIKVNSALYGRQLGGNVCPHNSIKTTDCAAPTSLEVVKDECAGKQSCEVKASNGVFDDPCVGTFKYLEVDYTCISSKYIKYEHVLFAR